MIENELQIVNYYSKVIILFFKTQQNCSPNAKLPPLRNPKSKIIMKTIQNKQKKQNVAAQSQNAASSRQRQNTPDVAEKYQFLSAESNNEDSFLTNASDNEPVLVPIKPDKQPVNPKMQRSTSSSILEKQ